jgi:hypothetical protein
MCAINFFLWIGLIDMFVFGVFVQCEEELKLKNFEHKMVRICREIRMFK